MLLLIYCLTHLRTFVYDKDARRMHETLIPLTPLQSIVVFEAPGFYGVAVIHLIWYNAWCSRDFLSTGD